MSTLIGLIATLVILSVLAAVVVTKLVVLSDTAIDRILQEAVKELNAREKLTWTDIKLSSNGWTIDSDVFAKIDTTLGPEFVWIAGPDASGGTLRFRFQAIALTRTPSTNSSKASWK